MHSHLSNADEHMHEVTDEERLDLFDRNARYYLGVTGDEFRRRWNEGEYANETDEYVREAVDALAALLPLVEDQQPDPSQCAQLVEIARQVPDIQFLTREEAWEIFDRRAGTAIHQWR